MIFEGALGQAALMVVEALCVASLLLVLLRLRPIFGLTPVYTTLGVLYHLAGFLAGTLYVGFTPDIAMSPGSMVLFPANIFVVLFVYIQEDAYEARRLIYGLFAANVVVILMGILISYHLASPLIINPHQLAPELFLQHPRIALVGTSVLFVDTILIVLVYEWFKQLTPASRFMPIWLSMTLVLALDQVWFATGSFVELPAYRSILVSGLIGKAGAALIYSTALTLYLSLIEREPLQQGAATAIGDVFHLLTYRQKYEALRSQATKDALTGLYNRGYFNEALPRLMAAAKSEGKALSLLMIDVDDFKKINDTVGHLEGDRILQCIGVALMAEARGSDVVCRYGGEELAAILPETDLAQGYALARRIQAAIPKLCTWHPDKGITNGVTVTIGLAVASEAESSSELVARADERLYAGKRAGRNCVVGAEGLAAQ
jgi:diguanylate cyclase (GGDEF)-like protein